MALADIVRSGIALAKKTLNDGALLSTVTLETWVSNNDYGEATYGAPVAYQALVSNADDSNATMRGVTLVARCAVTFLEDVTIGLQDRITLADGSTGPLVRVDEGVVSADGRMMVVAHVGYKQ